MKFFLKASEISSNIYQTIIAHPFNQELMTGVLSHDKFAYYIEQDSLYLQDFARCHALIAARIPLKYSQIFLKYADYAFIAEQEVVHHFFRKTFNFKETGLITTATLGYTSYLLRICALESVEVAVAAILPCFTIYRDVGLLIAKNSAANNPYARWIETYSGEDFGVAVNQAIAIFDELADAANEVTRQKMLDAYYKSTCLEWHFWNDAYHLKRFDNLDN
jgi:thiaminase/transcriptional activator TenA